MVEVVGIRFKPRGKVYYFSPQGLDIKEGSSVIVETSRGVEFGQVVLGPREISKDQIQGDLKDVLRIATEEDHDQQRENKNAAKEAYLVCLDKIKDHGLVMRLISAEYTFDKTKLIFYFTAEGRVDFRELVRDLAAVFRTRIELRQIGVRDEAKVIGGLGSCGRECCCSSFLSDFAPVTIKMAKDQGLSLNPANISGICGRLLCCLRYEQEGYEEVLKRMPKQGFQVTTPLGKGLVVDTYNIQELVKVKVEVEDSFETHFFALEEVDFSRKSARPKKSCPQTCKKFQEKKKEALSQKDQSQDLDQAKKSILDDGELV